MCLPFHLSIASNFLSMALLAKKYKFFPQDVFPCTAENYFNLLLSDDSSFTNEYRSARKDTNLTVSTKTAYNARIYCIATTMPLLTSHTVLCHLMLHVGFFQGRTVFCILA